MPYPDRFLCILLRVSKQRRLLELNQVFSFHTFWIISFFILSGFQIIYVNILGTRAKLHKRESMNEQNSLSSSGRSRGGSVGSLAPISSSVFKYPIKMK